MAQNKAIYGIKYGSTEPYFGTKVLTILTGNARLVLVNEQSKRHACEARFLIMIELTTGIVFLMSSLYGAGNVKAQTYQIPADITVDDIEVTEMTDEQTRSFTDSKVIEAYLRKEFAETPILVDIARCESTFRQFHKDGTVVRGRVDSDDVGVMQINTRYHGDTATVMDIDLTTIEGNVAYAKYLYDKFGTKPWSASEKCWSKTPTELAVK